MELSPLAPQLTQKRYRADFEGAIPSRVFAIFSIIDGRSRLQNLRQHAAARVQS